MNAFSSANLAVVAYAEVEGSAGASTATNSGVRTTRIALGQYAVVLPTNLAQEQARDLIFVQPKSSDVFPNTKIMGLGALVVDSMATTKIVKISNVTTCVDCDFSILILRTTVPPPVGAPA